MNIGQKYITRNKLLNGYQLSKLYTFEVAARHESFALAAEELSISPSAVSHRINQFGYYIMMYYAMSALFCNCCQHCRGL